MVLVFGKVDGGSMICILSSMFLVGLLVCLWFLSCKCLLWGVFGGMVMCIGFVGVVVVIFEFSVVF